MIHSLNLMEVIALNNTDKVKAHSFAAAINFHQWLVNLMNILDQILSFAKLDLRNAYLIQNKMITCRLKRDQAVNYKKKRRANRNAWAQTTTINTSINTTLINSKDHNNKSRMRWNQWEKSPTSIRCPQKSWTLTSKTL